MQRMTNYGTAIRDGFVYLLANHPEVFTIGQGLWSPWYVGNSMTNLDKEFGKERVIDTPVSELACTGAALGAALAGKRPIVIHPRVDFALLAIDQIVNQAAKWCHMFGGQVSVPLTIRAIVNRGGEQGAQHSQSLYSWFAHIPGLRVILPATASDARDLLVASVLGRDPVLYIDDRWLYEQEEELAPIQILDLRREGPRQTSKGEDITLVGASYASLLCKKADQELRRNHGVTCDVFDLRVINPLNCETIVESVQRTGRLLVVDCDWSSCGLAAEVIAQVAECVEPAVLRCRPARVTLPDAPAPTSSALESAYYPKMTTVVERAMSLLKKV